MSSALVVEMTLQMIEQPSWAYQLKRLGGPAESNLIVHKGTTIVLWIAASMNPEIPYTLPKRLYKETKAWIIFKLAELKDKHNFIWSGPEIAICPYVQKSRSWVTSTGKTSPETRPCFAVGQDRRFCIDHQRHNSSTRTHPEMHTN